MGLVIEITDLEFDSCTFESSTPVMVLFTAERCAVCKELLPIVEEVAEKYADSLKVYKIDVDTYKSIATRFRLRGIPQILFFKEGEIKDRIGGLRSEEELEEVIDGLI